MVAALLLCVGCRRNGGSDVEVAYVATAQVNLRDRLAQVYNKVGVLQNGERVEVLERQRRFARVRSSSGLEGWVEQRYLVGPEVFEAFNQLAAENKGAPSQAHAITRAELNLHIGPSREAELLYQLKEGDRVELIKRAVTERKGTAPAKPDEKGKPILEDWWLVRDQQGRTGWVLGRILDVDLPLEIAQYAEGQRIVAYFVLNEVQDGERKVPQYLTLVTEPADGLPWDFSQIRIFTWNLRRHRYETAYRERKLFGLLPARTGVENFEKEGTLPVFVIRAKSGDAVIEKKYKLNGPMVRRVLSPGEEAAKPAAKTRKGR